MSALTLEEASQVLAKYGYVVGNDNTARFKLHERIEIKHALRVLHDAAQPQKSQPEPKVVVEPPTNPRQPEDVAPRGERPGLVPSGQPVPAAINKVLMMAKNREGIPDVLFVVAYLVLDLCPLPPEAKAAIKASLDAAKAIDTAIEQAPVKPKKVKKV